MAYGLSSGHVTLKGQTRDPNTLLELETSNLLGGFVLGMPNRRTNNFPESGRGLGHVTPYNFWQYGRLS